MLVCMYPRVHACSTKFNKLFLPYSYFSLSAFSSSEENPLNAYYLKCLESLTQQLNSSWGPGLLTTDRWARRTRVCTAAAWDRLSLCQRGCLSPSREVGVPLSFPREVAAPSFHTSSPSQSSRLEGDAKRHRKFWEHRHFYPFLCTLLCKNPI